MALLTLQRTSRFDHFYGPFDLAKGSKAPQRCTGGPARLGDGGAALTHAQHAHSHPPTHPPTHTHAHARTRTHARTHIAHTHAHAHTRTHAHTSTDARTRGRGRTDARSAAPAAWASGGATHTHTHTHTHTCARRTRCLGERRCCRSHTPARNRSAPAACAHPPCKSPPPPSPTHLVHPHSRHTVLRQLRTPPAPTRPPTPHLL